MASLREKIKLNGQLGQTSEEELQQLSSAAGRAAPPTNPVEASVVGASPDSAKMAGTGQQKGLALRESIQGQASLRDTLRTQGPRSAATTEEEQQKDRAERLSGLGSLQGRVQALAGQMTAQAAASQQATGALQVRPESMEDIPEATRPQLTAALQELQGNPNNPALIKQINNMLGITNVNEMLTAENLTNRFLSTAEVAGQATADAFANQATVNDLNLQELGFSDPNELANLLGVTPEELGGLNIRQLIEETEAQIQAEHNSVGNLQQKASDPNLGPAERAEARKQLRDMGAVGIRKAESDIDSMADQIANADTVSFGGQEVPISEMLEDEYLSGLTAAYLQAPEGDPLREQLEENEPELVEWINQNKNILDQAIQDIEGGLGEFAKINYRNQALADTEVGKLSDDIMSALFEDWGTIRDTEYGAQEVPDAIEVLQNPDIPKSKRENLYVGITEVQDMAPEMVKDLASLSEAELAQTGIYNRNSDKWQYIQGYMEDYNRVKNMDPTDPDSVAAAAFGEGTTAEQAKALVKKASIMDRSGLFGESSALSKYGDTFGADGDILDRPEELSQKLISMLSPQGQGVPMTIRDLLNPSRNSPPLGKDMSTLSSHTAKTTPLFDKIASAFERPGDKEVSMDEILEIEDTLNTEDLEGLYKIRGGRMDRDAVDTIAGIFGRTEGPNLERTLLSGSRVEELPSPDKDYRDTNPAELGKLRDSLNQVRSYFNSLPDRDTLEANYINNIENSLRDKLRVYEDKYNQKTKEEGDKRDRQRAEEEARAKEEAKRGFMHSIGLGPIYEQLKASDIDLGYLEERARAGDVGAISRHIHDKAKNLPENVTNYINSNMEKALGENVSKYVTQANSVGGKLKSAGKKLTSGKF